MRGVPRTGAGRSCRSGVPSGFEAVQHAGPGEGLLHEPHQHAAKHGPGDDAADGEHGSLRHGPSRLGEPVVAAVAQAGQRAGQSRGDDVPPPVAERREPDLRADALRHADQEGVRDAERIAEQRLDDRSDRLPEEGGAGPAHDDADERSGEQPHEMEQSAQAGREVLEQARRDRVDEVPGPEDHAGRDGDDGGHDDVDHAPPAGVAAGCGELVFLGHWNVPFFFVPRHGVEGRPCAGIARYTFVRSKRSLPLSHAAPVSEPMLQRRTGGRMEIPYAGRQDVLKFLGREIADYNDFAPEHDRAVIRMVYELTRQAILMFRINPMIPVDYGDGFRWLSAEIGSDGMDLIADGVRWHGARRWRDDPDVSAEGAAPRTFYGRIAVPGENLEDEYTTDLTHKTETVTYKKALEYIWREDNITGGRWNRDIGPWSYK